MPHPISALVPRGSRRITWIRKSRLALTLSDAVLVLGRAELVLSSRHHCVGRLNDQHFRL